MEKLLLTKGWTYCNVRTKSPLVKIDLPHDAMLHEKRISLLKNGAFSAYFPGGEYLYSKEIFGENRFKDKSLIIEFEGVYWKSEVFLNGEKLGGRISGYANFFIDISGKVKIGEINLLEVKVDNTQVQNARWYTGSGIYRNVNLYVGNKEYIRPEGIRITTKSIYPAVLEVEVDAVKKDESEIRVILYKEGQAIARETGAKVQFHISDPKLWSAESPELYEVEVHLFKKGEIIDHAKERTGIRILNWSSGKGFLVNGEPIKLKGGSVHADHGILGACSFKEAEVRRIKILKKLGFNAIRYAHNPASKDFLDACDELGMYVINESFDCWKTAKTEYDYSLYFDREWERDIDSMINVSYNHPSVIMYSTGNEIPLTGRPEGADIMKQMHRFIKSMDATRATTHSFNMLVSAMGFFGFRLYAGHADDKVDPKRKRKKFNAAGSVLANLAASAIPWAMRLIGTPKRSERIVGDSFNTIDIVGYNYASHLYEAHHKFSPQRIMYASESYPREFAENWEKVERLPFLIGEFIWTAWDYLGEAGAGVPVYHRKHTGYFKSYPCITAGGGAVDIIGNIDAQGHFASIVWGNRKDPYIGVKPVQHAGKRSYKGQWRSTDVIDSWTWPGQEGKKTQIEVYGKGSSVALLQNGKLLVKKPLVKHKALFSTIYSPGELAAFLYNEKDEISAKTVLQTAGEETQLCVFSEHQVLKADGSEILYMQLSITDKEGVVKMLSDRQLSVRIDGPAMLQAFGSANPFNEESYTKNVHTTHNGRALLILRGTGERGFFAVEISAQGITPKLLKLEAC